MNAARVNTARSATLRVNPLRMTLENIAMALESLWGNRLRSLLAALGIVIGVFAVTTMVSLGEMATAGIQRDLNSLIGRAVTVDQNTDTGNSNLVNLLESDVTRLKALGFTPIPQLYVSAELEIIKGKRKALSLTGVPGDLPRLQPTTKVARGRFYSETEAKNGAAVIVLGNTTALEAFKNRDPLGQTLRVYYSDGNRADFTVIGVLAPVTGLFSGAFTILDAYAPLQFLWNTAPSVRRGEFGSLRLELKKSDDSKTIQGQIQRYIDSRYTPGRFVVRTTESDAGTFNSILSTLQALLASIAGLSLLVGGIGIMNIMLVSVTERTREIGLRKALGATAALIRGQFLVESVVLTVFGGLIGLGLAVLLLWAATLVVPFFGAFKLNPSTVILALGVSATIGLVFGVLPAARAAKLNAIESLRHE
jgi:putative ABC transport system permease protein